MSTNQVTCVLGVLGESQKETLKSVPTLVLGREGTFRSSSAVYAPRPRQ